MTGSEILAMRGRVAVNTEALKALSNGIDVDIDTLRSKLDKFAPKTELDSESIEVISQRLTDSISQYKELHGVTEKIRKELQP
jgi:hypothetical protein